MRYLVDFFFNNKDKLSEYFENIKVNDDNSTIVKFVSKANEISLDFFINGELDESITDYTDKVYLLLDSENNLSDLNHLIGAINKPYEFILGSPFIKISKDNEPLIHSFRITIRILEV